MTTRNVHLDFHTSEKIKGIGGKFNKTDFQNALKKGKVQSVTVFAKCHHGYAYYPSKVNEVHPYLNFDLLSAEIEAAHEIGVKAPIYVTVGISQRDAVSHPEWLAYDFNTKKPVEFGGWDDNKGEEDEIPLGAWKLLCPVGGYREKIIAITEEICEKFTPDGLFYDIFTVGTECVCPDCVKNMKKRGYDPENLEDARKFYIEERIRLADDIKKILFAKNPKASLFFNNGAEIDRPEFLCMHTHFEMEDLPTAWGGYDKLPLRAKYLSKFGKEYVGMTGKFHFTWGEFGGFKNPDALKYECAAMLSHGAKCSVGDQLHPTGLADVSTYEEIGHAYSYVEKIEDYCLGSETYSDVALFLSEDNPSNQGLCLLLSENQIEFDVIKDAEEITGFDTLIVPDKLKNSEIYRSAILKHIQSGKNILLIGDAPARVGCAPKILSESVYDVDYILSDKDPAVLKTPFLSYTRSYIPDEKGFKRLAESVPLYFNRRYGHFCSHSNTPYDLEAKRSAALLKKDGIIYMSHNVPASYAAHGNYYLKKYFTAALKIIYENPLIRVEGLMSSGRITFRKNTDKKFYVINLLYASPSLRGNAFVLEDFPKLKDVRISFKIKEDVSEIVLVPQGKKIGFNKDGNGYTVAEPVDFSMHQSVVVYYR